MEPFKITISKKNFNTSADDKQRGKQKPRQEITVELSFENYLDRVIMNEHRTEVHRGTEKLTQSL